MAKPPPPPAPPPSGKKDAYTRYIQAHPILKPFGDRIRYWAKQYGLDPLYFAALIWFESGAEATRLHKPIESIVSPTGEGVGLGQINPHAHVGEYVPWLGRNLTRKDLNNPEINLHWSAMYFRNQKDQYGSYDAAYRQGYNRGYKGPGPFDRINAVPTASGSAPQDSAQRSVETSAAKSSLLQGEAFLNEWKNLNTVFEAYTGRMATRKEARAIIAKNWSTYHLELQLSKSKAFVGSPVWQHGAPGVQSTWEAIYGQNSRAPREIVAYSIIHSLGPGDVAELIRRRQDYVKSNEFKTGVANLDTVYRKIYGQPDELGQNTIKQAVLNGWNENEFARYLRAQPEYSRSQEYQSNALGVLEGLGMVTGTGVSLSPGTPAPYDSNTQVGALPPDKRIKGKTGIAPPGTSYTPSLNG